MEHIYRLFGNGQNGLVSCHIQTNKELL